MSNDGNGVADEVAELDPAAVDAGAADQRELDVARDSDVPISTQIFWQITYQIDAGRLLPGARLPPVRELGAALRVNPNTIRAVYRRLADAGYVTSRQGAGTRVAESPPRRGGPEALAAIVAELLRRATQSGFSPDEVSSATFAAASEWRRPGPRTRVIFAECTPADVASGAAQIAEAFPESIEVAGALLEDLPERLGQIPHKVVATSTFHLEEAQAAVAGRAPVVAMLADAPYLDLVHEVASLPPGTRLGLVCATPRGVANMEEILRLSGAHGVGVLAAIRGTGADLGRVEEEADIILLSREALADGLASRFSRPERIREWVYRLDPSGFELLRQAIETSRSGATSPGRA
jgi:DNA-binding transcriptional regulator YhcF (GntR family)